MYKKALKLKLRFETQFGNICLEDLMDLTLSQLNDVAKHLKRQLVESQEEDFISERSSADKVLQLKFDLILDIINDKKEAAKAQKDRAERADKKRKLMEILARKQDASLEEKTIEELQAELEELDD